MTAPAVNLDWEEQEIDRSFDLANMVFGAALGAYVGVVVATGNISVSKVWWLSAALFGLALMLNGLRSLAHLVRGTHSGPIGSSAVTAGCGLVSTTGGIAQSGFRLDIAAALGTGWLAALLLLLGSNVVRKYHG